MQHTKIEWVFNPDGSRPGWSWSPITGCLGPDGKSPCPYCYARKLANGRLKQRYLANGSNIAPPLAGYPGIEVWPNVGPFYPRFWPERIPAKYWIPTQGAGLGINVKGKGIFVCDMGELFGDWIPREWQEEIFKVIRANPDCRFYLLTKQPQNLASWSPFPRNCHVGVTATGNEMYKLGKWYLNRIEAKVKYISFEPLLNEIKIESAYDLSEIQWVILGSQTKPYKPPKIEWVEKIAEAADKAGVPVFLKNNLWELLYSQGWDNDIFWANERASLRQEMPE